MQEPPSLPRICITATGTTAAELAACARRGLEQSRFVELRLDWVANPAEAIAMVPKLLAGATASRRARLPVLQGTCRRRENGGRFVGTVSRQFELLQRAAQAGCRVLDIEVESAEEAGDAAVAALRERALLIVSYHDFQSTPAFSSATRRLRRFAADYYKLVPTAGKQTDNCALLDWLQSASESAVEQGKWIGFSMAEAGVPSRVLALSRGSAWVYAAPPAAAGSGVTAAPGQLDWETLRYRYRAERLTVRTALYGLLGNPVRHSIGAAIHNASFQARGLDAVYLPLLASGLADFRKAVRRYPLAGFSVTIPHKQAILRFVDRADRWVHAAGAANTVRIRRGRWDATNTDLVGIQAPLRRAFHLSAREQLPKDFRAVIVGNGGSARAAFIALRGLGCGTIFVAGRNSSRRRQFVRELGGEGMGLESLRQKHFDLLIHATPVGMWPQREQCLLCPDQLEAGTVFDLVYNPPETRLLQLARARGCRTISGLEMFLTQAAKQFEFWTGEEAPGKRMRQVAWRELDRLRQTQTISGMEES